MTAQRTSIFRGRFSLRTAARGVRLILLMHMSLWLRYQKFGDRIQVKHCLSMEEVLECCRWSTRQQVLGERVDFCRCSHTLGLGKPPLGRWRIWRKNAARFSNYWNCEKDNWNTLSWELIKLFKAISVTKKWPIMQSIERIINAKYAQVASSQVI